MSGDSWDDLHLDTDAVALAWSDSRSRMPAAIKLTATAERFVIGEELGRGAMGAVLLAEDLDLQREVAIKRLASDAGGQFGGLQAFVEEARLTGSLDHPNIVPVYELGQQPDGQPFFAMRLLRGRPLSVVLRLLRQGDEPTTELFTRTRLLTTFLQLCGAVSFAHARGVVHRDLKPENAVVGRFGDIQLLDWGIAMRVDNIDAPAPPALRLAVGTPGFIAPELLLESAEVIPSRLDIFGLGALLYELLTLRRPFEGRTAQDVLEATMAGRIVPPSELAPERNLPQELDDICLAALAHDPTKRTASVEQLAREVEDFLEGIREARRRAEFADRAAADARATLVRHDAMQQDLDVAIEQVQGLQRDVMPWDRIEKKRPLWRAEDHVREVEAQRAELIEEAEALYRQALEEVQEHPGATEGLIDLWMDRLTHAEQAGDGLAARRTAARIRALDPASAAARLRGDGRLTLRSDPPGARVWLHRFEERDRLLMPADGRDLGVTPLEDVEIPRGRHLLMVEGTKRAAARLPLWLPRGGRIEQHVTLRVHEAIPEGMVYVSAGSCRVGGAPLPGQTSRPHRTVDVDDFAIATLPVTLREYAAFLDILAATDPDQATQRTPRSEVGEALLVLDADGQFGPALGALTPASVDPYSRRLARRLPVVGVTWEDAVAYAEHRSAVLGRALTLPTVDQWEKAARGVDGRPYPWGDTWDAGFANRAGSRPGVPQLEPVGTFGMDQSVYGMRDACGGAREWCLDEAPGDRRACRGGDWTAASGRSLGAALSAVPGIRSLSLGFRLATTAWSE